ncbi:MAG: DUF3313 family protein [Steroidobacteraceae bacterium]
MTNPELLYRVARIALVTASLAMPFTLAHAADDALPEVTDDGLHLQKSRDARVVYVRPGATLEPYKRVAILECYVEFERDWQRRYNQSASIGARLTDADADKIKSAIAAEFKKVFTDELQTKGGYQVVDVAAPDVMILRPALVNVVVTAPDIANSGMTRTIVSSAGQMTLFLELYDSVSSQILARIIDPKADPSGFAQRASRVTNKAAADEMLRAWAQKLRRHLDAVHGAQAAVPAES